MNNKIQDLIRQCKEYAQKNGFKLNPNSVIVENIARRLLENEEKYGHRYCPCRIVSGDKERDKDKICSCIWHKDEIQKNGHCLCNLFIKDEKI